MSSGVVNSTSYFVRVDTLSDCLLLRVDFYVLFFSISEMDTGNYYYLQGQDLLQSTDAAAGAFFWSVTYHQNVQYLMPLRGYYGDTSKHNIRWGLMSSVIGNGT